MNRRSFMTGLAATGIVNRNLAQARPSPEQAQLVLGPASATAVPTGFVGLSYESAQLANPAFFAAENAALVALFRELSPQGNLRLGGGSSEYTTYSAVRSDGPPPFETFGPDTSKTVKSGTVTTAFALQNLRGFLDAVGWNCLYGLNLGQGTVENATAEAAAVRSILGPRLLALQIGNEPDSFRRRFRTETYTPADFLAEWTRFHDAIVQVVPDVRFAGPDISNKLAYLTAFAEAAPRYPDVILLTSHYYAMGPAGNPDATLDNLLEPDPKLTTLKRRDLHVIAEAQAAAHLPYRMSEGNSCWDGGKPGVSDTFAAALWCADYMLTCMGRGWQGVNLHGGGNGLYTPIAGAPSTGFVRRPEYFGIKFAQRFVSSRTVEVTLTGTDRRVSAFAFEHAGRQELVLVNKTAAPVHCGLPPGCRAAPVLQLRGPAIDAKEGITLSSLHGRHGTTVVSDPFTATVYALRSSTRA